MVASNSQQKENFETATVAGGCFWCTEAIFKRLKGVESVVAGYTGGARENINRLRFGVNNGKLFQGINLSAQDIADLIQSGTSTQTVGANVFELGYDQQKINVKRLVDGEVIDRLSIEETVLKQQAIETLFPRPLRENPYGAPAAMDENFRRADLLKTVGVNWERG